jgi:hypothetical protein
MFDFKVKLLYFTDRPISNVSLLSFSERGRIQRHLRIFQSVLSAKARLGQVQQKVCTGNAVVKPGKLYAVKYQVYQYLRLLV